MTKVTVLGNQFLIDGKPTYDGRFYHGKPVEGLLFNVRAVQATFDDENSETQKKWDYPDTGKWDPKRNVDEFCAALPLWRDHGVLAFTINFQGGGPLFSPEIYHHYSNNAFHLNGELKSSYAYRVKQVLEAADALGMVVMVGLFYWKQTEGMTEAGVWNAARNALAFLRSTGFQNFMIEIANENCVAYEQKILQQENVHEMINGLRNEFPEMLFSTSLPGMDITRNLPTPALVAASDYILLHGNECLPDTIKLGIAHVLDMPAYQKSPKPIVINEDSPGVPNLDAAFEEYVSWGYYDQGYGGEDAYGGDQYMNYKAHPRESQIADLSGFQTPPVNWGINTPEKKAFFERVSEITGMKPGQ